MPAVISKMVLVLAESFGESLNATRVATAIGQGLCAHERLECDLCPLETVASGPASTPPGGASKLLDGLDFDRRMRAARALLIARERLDDRTLAGSVAFEAATRARQSGVPAYAVTARNELDPFEARIVDLQVILEAGTTRALEAAGGELAAELAIR
jgi:glycerate kinase